MCEIDPDAITPRRQRLSRREAAALRELARAEGLSLPALRKQLASLTPSGVTKVNAQRMGIALAAYK